ncbi:protein GDAP2 homolog [Oscarella lobularis]|uniref:protein GDAP2 homolog n=1 Tax=Oscarella lobularis TaxID=121494 RepID=UPI0033135084
MDPLGANLGIVQVSSLVRWVNADNPAPLASKGAPDRTKGDRESSFPVRKDLNSKIALWEGDLTKLDSQAIVNSTNEALNDRNELSERIHELAGPELAIECREQLQGCRTGEAKVSKAYKLPARYVIHTVGPRYNEKYKTAAESALFSCYRSVLQLCREYNLDTLGLSVINSIRRGYPPEEGAHIAIRTVRRFLERHGNSIDVITFVVANQDKAVYESLLPLYFPRTSEEETVALSLLPDDIGNEEGEPVIEERKIRISDKPVAIGQKEPETENVATIDHNDEETEVGGVGAHAFAVMEDDHDVRRVEQLSMKPRDETLEAERARRYQRWLKRSKTENFSDIAQLRIIYQSGIDYLGRPVIVFVGKNFSARTIDLDRAVAYFIGFLDAIVNQDYTIIFLHTLTTGDNLPDFSTLKSVYQLVDNKYRKNLRSFYILHPTFWSKVVTWFFTTFTASSVKQKVHHISGVEHLYDFIAPDQLDLPAFVMDYDRRINGLGYHAPSGRDSKDDGGTL